LLKCLWHRPTKFKLEMGDHEIDHLMRKRSDIYTKKIKEDLCMIVYKMLSEDHLVFASISIYRFQHIYVFI
jgi:hypothetical protein